jgi:hypothetical protein
VALGAIRNTEWLSDSGLAVGAFGVGCDAGCRAFDINAIVTDDVFVAGDVARFPHPLFDYHFLALEHWGNAVEQATVAAHNMVCAAASRRPHVAVPAFWSSQFGVNIKSVGVPSAAEEVAITQGSLEEASFVATYGKEGQLVAAVTCNQAKWLEHYQRLIEHAAPFPPTLPGADQSTRRAPVPAAFPDPRVPTHEATVVLTGHDPNENGGCGGFPGTTPQEPPAHPRMREEAHQCPKTPPSFDKSMTTPIAQTPTRFGPSCARHPFAGRKMVPTRREPTS